MGVGCKATIYEPFVDSGSLVRSCFVEAKIAVLCTV